MEGSLVAYKVFTNGSVLNASEINDNLMNQSVIVFTNDAARTAAIPTPIEGMVTYLESTDQVYVWTGATWTLLGAAAGLTYINTFSGTSTSSFSVNSVFSSTYKNYKVIISSETSTTSQLRMRMRVAGVDNSASLYFTYWTGINSSGATTISEGSTSSSPLSRSVGGTNLFHSIEFFDPFVATPTRVMGHSYNNANADQIVGGFSHAVSTSYDGFTLFPSSGVLNTVTVRVYGYKD